MISQRKLAFSFCCLLLALACFVLKNSSAIWAANTSYYIDSTGGSDSNDGLSPATAWQTFTPVTTKSNSGSKFEPGDNILFKRGQTHQSLNLLVIDGIGTSDDPITVGAYGTGADPVLQNTDTAVDQDAVMRVNGSYIVVEDIKIDDQTVSNITEHGIRIHGANNTVQNVEITGVGIGITVNTPDHTITGSNFHDLIMVVNTPGGDDDYGASGISVMASNVLIENNTFSDLLEASQDYGTDGDAMEIFGAASNVTFRYNTVTTTDNFIEVGGSDSAQIVDEFKIYYNKIIDAKRALAVHNDGGLYEITLQDLYFENNTVIKSSGFTATELFNFDGAPGSSFRVRNNIFSYDTLTNWDNVTGNYVHQYNLYDLTSVSNGPGTAWALGTGELLNEDPLFTDEGSDDYSLQAGSPAKDSGIDLGYTLDRDEVAVPQDGGFDLGAFERPVETIVSPFTKTNWSTAGSILSSSAISTAVVGEVSLSSGWYDNDWMYRRVITIPAGTTASTLTNYPLLVSISNNSALATNTQSAGQDLVFTDSDGQTLLDFEIEQYDDGTGTLVAWVRVPNVSATSDTTLYLYYGNAAGGLSSVANPTGVWDSGYAAVYHFSETTGTQFDSTSNNNDMTGVAVTTQGSAVGSAGGANAYDGIDDVLTGADSSSLDISPNLTLETWIKFDVLPADRGPAETASVIRKTHSVSPWQTYLLNINGSDNKVELSFPTLAEDFRGAGGGTALSSTSDFYYIAAVRNTSTAGIYLNGASDAAGGYDANDSGALFNSDSTLNLGSSHAGSGHLDGVMDEVRISNVARSSAYLAAVYENITTPSTFYTLGSEMTKSMFTGSFTSPVYNTEDSVYWDTLSFTTTTPNDSTVTVKVRSSNSPAMTGATAFGSCTAVSSGSDLSDSDCVTDGDQYIQYQVNFSSDVSDDVPSIQDITIAFSAIPASPSPSPTPSADPGSSSSSDSFSGTSQASADSARPQVCSDGVPAGQPDLFEIRRSGATAELYFTPVLDKTNAYHVVFGFKEGDERFGGIALPVESSANSGVQKISIHHLNPKQSYAFSVAAVNDCSVGTWSNWLTAKSGKGLFFRY